MGSLYGFEVKTELPLRRLNAAAGTRGELRIELATGPLERPAGEPLGQLLDDEGRCWYASHELEGGRRLLWMPPSGSFLLDPGAGRVAVQRDDGDDELLEHRIASSAVCTLLSLRSDLVLHAAAVEREGRAVVFCGPSMRGKSTLARALGEAGCGLLGEDGIALELGGAGAVAFPGARGVRLRRRGGDGRVEVELLDDPGPGEPPPCPVAAVVLLAERGEELEVEPLEPPLALALLTPSLVHSGDREAIGAAFDRLARLLGTVPALRVRLPDDLRRAGPAATEALDMVAAPG